MTGQDSISPLPNFTRFITTHNPAGQAIIHSEGSGNWTTIGDKYHFNVAYTTSEFPANLSNEADIAAYENTMKDGKLGLVSPGGTVCRVVDFAPNKPGLMHRTQSLDYGIVLEGELDMVLDSGDVRRMRRGDIAVQRATMHEWRNPSTTDWARMLFVLQECEPITVGGKILKENLSGNTDIPASNL